MNSHHLSLDRVALSSRLALGCSGVGCLHTAPEEMAGLLAIQEYWGHAELSRMGLQQVQPLLKAVFVEVPNNT